MKGMERIQDIVEAILIMNPATRGDDRVLYFEVCKYINPISAGLSFEEVAKRGAYYGLPTCETVRRCRQKAQQEHPECNASHKERKIRLDHRKEVEAWLKRESARMAL